ncbi:hypothetical protein [Hyphomicrobium sp.]|uniref:hypothetical protein n=1 Tax=Hyphomicrobium sp. TaxID=82 RepID=UPI0025B9656C|nr:hypothetical protein [Hyphomicrobium sp.]MCC7253066.1 hypothetical protein [Hyphomicrobium sp.]
MGRIEKQKTCARTEPRNRYVAGAKLSEHKFLRILRGYAHALPIAALEPTTHVTAKTIRATYGTLRGKLADAAIAHPERFGQAGRILMHEDIPALHHALLCSRRFKRHRQRHAPRLSCPVEERHFVTEKIVRLLCALDLRDVALREHDDAVTDLIAHLSEAIPRLHPRAPKQDLATFIPGAKPFAHSELRLYEDYRRYLLRNPLDRQ